MHTLISVTFSLPPGDRGWLRLLLVALPGLFCLHFFRKSLHRKSAKCIKSNANFICLFISLYQASQTSTLSKCDFALKLYFRKHRETIGKPCPSYYPDPSIEMVCIHIGALDSHSSKDSDDSIIPISQVRPTNVCALVNVYENMCREFVVVNKTTHLP